MATQAAKARAEFDRKGLSIAGWAAKNNFSKTLVYEVLGGYRRCVRGQSHKVAVLLGMKDGVITE